MSKIESSVVPGNGMAVRVLGNKKHDLDFALRLWKKKLKDSEIIDNLKTRREYEKPSVTKRRNKDEAIRNAKRNKNNY
jgi:ribosomal protein S21